MKRRIEGTDQGSFSDVHLQAYLDEFCFRHNRRREASRGLLFLGLLLFPGVDSIGLGDFTHGAASFG